jgi:serine/tyrosine/threonine adenylyltransferase
MVAMRFDNRFLRALPGDADMSRHSRQVHGAMWSRVDPTPVSSPQLIAYSPEVSAMLGLSDVQMQSPALLDALSGNGTLPGMEPYATVYGGHQFGNWAGQLGDGRAILLGELVTRDDQRYELQLKGAGPTPYSRRADGRAVLRSSIREFLCSEAMHHLGIPTTRALSLVQTGDQVLRDMFYNGDEKPEPGAIVCRVAPSFLRFGHYELFASRGETALLQALVDFTIASYYPDCESAQARTVAWFTQVCERTAQLIAHWMRVGFVHGVMNTDNMSILGLTIDYGPYGWTDNFDGGWTPNTTDAGGKRYCYGRQPGIARWNLNRLAEALLTLGGEIADFDAALKRFDDAYADNISRMFAAKFGFDRWRSGDDADSALVDAIFALMTQAEVDMTEFFRRLVTARSAWDLREAFYVEALFDEHRDAFDAWMTHYRARIASNEQSTEARTTSMNAANPRYVLRNYLAQQAIDAAHEGDTSKISALLDVLRRPYDEQPGREEFAAKRPDWARNRAGCSMLSCSS